jgi:DNA adenine methylase
MTDIKRPILRYHGGKFMLANWIISHFPPHRIYTEVFGGAGSVLMQKRRSYGEVYNDTWETVVNVFKVLRDPVEAAELERLLILTPYSRTEFVESREQSADLDPIEKARRTIVGSFMGFSSASSRSTYSTGFRSNSNRSGTPPAQDWNHFSAHIKSFTERLKGVVIENRDYADVIGMHDGPDTLHYLDPPYPHSTRVMTPGRGAYACEMDDSMHVKMADVLKTISGMAIVSGYRCELYDTLFHDWGRVERKAFADGAAPRVECLWINPAAASKLNKKLF